MPGTRAGVRGMESQCLLGTESHFRRRVMVRAVQQCECMQLNMVKIVCFILCDFYHNKENILKKTSKKEREIERRPPPKPSFKVDILTKVPLGVLEKV